MGEEVPSRQRSQGGRPAPEGEDGVPGPDQVHVCRQPRVHGAELPRDGGAVNEAQDVEEVSIGGGGDGHGGGDQQAERDAQLQHQFRGKQQRGGNGEHPAKKGIVHVVIFCNLKQPFYFPNASLRRCPAPPANHESPVVHLVDEDRVPRGQLERPAEAEGELHGLEDPLVAADCAVVDGREEKGQVPSRGRREGRNGGGRRLDALLLHSQFFGEVFVNCNGVICS